MTSPVDTSVKWFSSDMPNAPVLNGVAGSLISLLDACLKDGFGTKSVTSLVVSGGIATMTFSGGASPALTDSVVLVSGATPAGLNGEQKVLSADAATVKFATALADTTATGTISFKMAPAGWSKPFSGTNLAAYKSSDVASTKCVLRVDDTGAQVARVVGYESMTDINTGVGPFPTSAQITGGGYWAKSTAANSTANKWVLVADSRFFIFYAAPASGATAAQIQGFTRAFGDALPFRPSGDAYACVLSYSATATVASQNDGTLDNGRLAQNAMPRSYSGLGSSSLHAALPYIGDSTALSGGDLTMGAFPSLVDGGLRLSKKYLATAFGAPPRADIPGLYCIPQSQVFDTFKVGDVAPGTGALAGRNLLALNPTNATLTAPINTNTGVSFVDITGPWR